ncbi:hypothetical protein ACET3Z_014459 [Daucus carota]
MSSVCISNCVNDTRVPVRDTFINPYKRPESEAEFVKTVKMCETDQGRRYPHHSRARVVDGVSCRQMYLRSYTFSKKESAPRKTKKCLVKVRDNVGISGRRPDKLTKGSVGGKKRPRAFSCATICNIFRRLLTCTTNIEVPYQDTKRGNIERVRDLMDTFNRK